MEAIKPQDMRYGNLIKGIYYTEGYDDDNEPKEVICKFLGYDPFSNYYWVDSVEKSEIEEFDRFEPIPLSEQRLIELGFAKHEKGWFWKNWGLNGTVIIVWMQPYERYGIQLGEGRTRVLNYVHQLQNLYYSLTGQELTFKE